MMENPVIHYRGADVRVTPDTARELVDAGEAILVSGTLPKVQKPAKAEAEKPEPEPKDPAPAPPDDEPPKLRKPRKTKAKPKGK